MSPTITGRTLALTLMLQAALAAAGEGPRADGAVKEIEAGPTRTGKERLGGKAGDEQRVDNCKVPLDQRGVTPRPDTCDADASAGLGR
jgi:hypothetical protein